MKPNRPLKRSTKPRYSHVFSLNNAEEARLKALRKKGWLVVAIFRVGMSYLERQGQ